VLLTNSIISYVLSSIGVVIAAQPGRPDITTCHSRKGGSRYSGKDGERRKYQSGYQAISI
jgi:hypothetical protein